MAICNITVDNDADFYRVFQYQTQDGTPIDITGAVLWMMLRRQAKDETAVLRLGTDTGEIVFIDATIGKWSIFIAQEELEKLGLGEYHQSLIMQAHGLKTGVWYGTFINNPGPSR